MGSAESTNDKGSRGVKSDRNYYILLVDDDAHIREITEARLIHAGFRVMTAVNGLHAVQKLKSSFYKINLIITDLSMPGLGGLDLISSVKNDPEMRHIPVIALTGNIQVDLLKAAKLKGAQEVLVKPITFQALLERIQMVI